MAEEHNQEAAAAAEEQTGQQFAVQRLYVKDISFEAPMGAEAFTKQWQPAVNQELGNKVNKLDDNNYEVTLTITVTVKLGEETAFLAEVHQAGIFAISGLDEQQLTHVLNTMCPNILFPYAREAIDNIVGKGSFPALMLPPVNFDALFAQAVQQQQQQAGEAPAEDTAH
ncbi:protein-export chaperone SecB [uncultured Pseudoteredinibacter sp.]|uniref:protein-export chaperone SecB n=1 Tax=uncultured Pseudoteredinibacter sp. TaxID=1641701 RepID=UPI00260C2767|nr:protein-export chaperone SecB [uncultured Pseudoteredinibacter sp.]